MFKRLTKKALFLLRLPEKYSFTLSKLRFFGLRKPKNSSFYPTSLLKMVTHLTFGSPSFYFLTKNSTLAETGKYIFIYLRIVLKE